MTVYATATVVATAKRLGVDLDKVTGTGAGGRVTVQDVKNAAPRRPVLAAGSSPAGLPHFAANPLLASYSQSHPSVVAQALTGGPAPTLFHAGDTPSFTASGNDPKALLNLPWEARHPAAKADQATWAAMFEKYGHNGTQDDALLKAGRAAQPVEFGGQANAAGNGDYQSRFKSWLNTSGMPNYNAPGAAEAASQKIGAETRQARVQARAEQAEATRKAELAKAAKAEADRSASRAQAARQRAGWR
jgi:hypothetical protein